MNKLAVLKALKDGKTVQTFDGAQFIFLRIKNDRIVGIIQGPFTLSGIVAQLEIVTDHDELDHYEIAEVDEYIGNEFVTADDKDESSPENFEEILIAASGAMAVITAEITKLEQEA